MRLKVRVRVMRRVEVRVRVRRRLLGPSQPARRAAERLLEAVLHLVGLEPGAKGAR